MTYRENNWGSDRKVKVVVAATVARAAQEISKSKYLRYSGRVEEVAELHDEVVIAK